MEYTTYDFYKNEYYGDTVDESSFAKWQARAADKLNYLCFGHITDEDIERYGEQIQKAACALIDVLYNLDYARNNANDPQKGNIKSMSSGGQSISFGTNETEYMLAMSNQHKQYDLMVNAVSEHLGSTGLLYAGV